MTPGRTPTRVTTSIRVPLQLFPRLPEAARPFPLLLGLHADDGRLHYAGHASSFSRDERARLTQLVEPLAPAGGAPGPAEGFGFTGEAPGGPSRWARGRSMEWTPVRPVLVVEVGWKHASGGRFRHGVRLLRFRPDKAPEQCTFAQLGAAAEDHERAPV